ncbi:M67 family metallopeptidase [Paenibacillus sp. FSL R5-0475]|uniref:M67 family metallopeptidase n=1 Tax=Paenibacillus sp. FSL R5-0475 TaxID=2921643 RepID=UPI0030FBE332
MAALQGNVQPIRLKYSVQQALGKHLLSSYPHEACGVLLGAAAAGGMLIDTYVPMRNVAPDPLHTFTPHPEEWIHVLYNEPTLIGLFHSHPNSEPVPSVADYKGLAALGSEFKVYLIGSPRTEDGCSPFLNGFYIERYSNEQGTAFPFPELSHAPLHVLLK